MKKLRLFWFVIFMTFGTHAKESTNLQSSLSEQQIFRRCYSQMTRLYLPANDSRLTLIKNKKATAVELCMNLIHKAQLNNQLQISGTGHTRIETDAIIKTFNTFHVSWFQAYFFARQSDEFFTANVYDSTEMSIPYTLAFFKPGIQFRETLTSEKAYESVRSTKKPIYFLDHFENGEYLKVDDKDVWVTGGQLEVEFKPDLVQTGKLLGFRESKRTKKFVEQYEGIKMNIVPGQAMGGGVLGSSSYLLLNSGLDREDIPDGHFYAHRSWSKAIVNDLLCRSLPVLTEEDVVQDIKNDSQLEFQKNVKCLTCHSTIDPLAQALKDKMILPVYSADGPKMPIPNKSLLVGDLRRKEGPVRPADNVKPGYLKMRAFNGNLIEKPAGSIKELAGSLSETDDYYICAAKHYFSFFTGVDVDLNSKVEPSSAVADYYNFVVAEGLKLKQHQDVRTLIKDILSSDFYSSPNFGVKDE